MAVGAQAHIVISRVMGKLHIVLDKFLTIALQKVLRGPVGLQVDKIEPSVLTGKNEVTEAH